MGRGVVWALVTASAASLAKKQGFTPLGCWTQGSVFGAKRVRWIAKRFQESYQRLDVVLARPGTEHGLGERLLDGGVQVALPAVPGPGAGVGDVSQGRCQFRIPVGSVIERVKVQAAGVAVHMTRVTAEPLVVRTAGIVKERFSLSLQGRSRTQTQRNRAQHLCP